MNDAMEVEIGGMAQDTIDYWGNLWSRRENLGIVAPPGYARLRYYEKRTRRKPGRKLGLTRAHGGRLTRRRCRRMTFLDFFVETQPTIFADPQSFMDEVDRMSSVTEMLVRPTTTVHSYDPKTRTHFTFVDQEIPLTPR